jgi:hypothetical protein
MAVQAQSWMNERIDDGQCGGDPTVFRRQAQQQLANAPWRGRRRTVRRGRSGALVPCSNGDVLFCLDVFPSSPATDPTLLTLTSQPLACCACANMHPQLTGPISRGVHCCAFALSLLIRMSLNILRIFLFFQIKKRRFHTCTLLFFFNAKSSQLLDVRL